MEEGNEEEQKRLKSSWMGICGRYAQYLEVTGELFRKEKQNLAWTTV